MLKRLASVGIVLALTGALAACGNNNNTNVGSVGVDWPGDFHMAPDGRLTKRGEREVSAFVYAGVGVIKASLFRDVQDDVFRLAPYFFRAAEAGRLFGLRLNGQWLHVGTPEAIDEAERAYARPAA